MQASGTDDMRKGCGFVRMRFSPATSRAVESFGEGVAAKVVTPGTGESRYRILETDGTDEGQLLCLDCGCALAILLNKRDAVESGDTLNALREDIEERMNFVKYAPVVICAE